MLKKFFYKKKYVFKLLFFLIIFLFSCIKKINVLYVYNWGLYIDESVISDFEKKYNVKVIYDTFDTNEEMYVIVREKARVYDVLCPTDYMIEKMDKKNLLYHYDIKLLDNYKYIDKDILKIMQTFDENNVIAVPYVYSTIGLIYNKTILDEKKLPYPKKWADIFDEKYKGEILLQNAIRDLLMVGLKKNNFSINTLDQNELDIATNDLIKQKPLVHAYMIDALRDMMVIGDGSIASMYSGEVEYIKTEGNKYEYEYILPEEGVNFTIDAWVIPENSKNKDLAKKWIDFMLEPAIALKNYDYMHYGVPNIGTKDLIIKRDGKDILKNISIFPDLTNLDKYELYKDIGDFENKYNDAFNLIKTN